MQQQARLPEFLVQNSLTALTQVFQECWSGVHPPSKNENLTRLRDFGFDLVWSIPPYHPPPMKIWLD